MKALFIDRDGTLINEPLGGYIDSLEKLQLLPFVVESLQKLQAAGYILVMISNQPGRGTEKFPEDSFSLPQNKLMDIFYKNEIIFKHTFFCPHFREDNCKCMKPKIGLLENFLKENSIDLKHSYTIGDRESDIQLAKNIGCQGITYGSSPKSGAVFNSNDWQKIVGFVLE